MTGASQVKDMAGLRFERLVVLSRAGSDKNGNAKWLCRCDCGTEKVILGQSLRSGATRSCACLSSEVASATSITHGLSHTKLYKAWFGMLQRCENPSILHWRRYGGRGIKVCERWHDFPNFINDMGERPTGCSIERIDNDGNYEPGNCRWATKIEQQNNMSTNRIIQLDGERMTLSQAARKFNIPKHTAGSRIRSGWTIEAAFKTPTKLLNTNHA